MKLLIIVSFILLLCSFAPLRLRERTAPFDSA